MSLTKMPDRCEREGRIAYEAGADIDDNIYPHGSVRALYWFKGWKAGEDGAAKVEKAEFSQMRNEKARLDFSIRHLSQLAYGGSTGFTLWHYQAQPGEHDFLSVDHFADAQGTWKVDDIVILQLDQGGVSLARVLPGKRAIAWINPGAIQASVAPKATEEPGRCATCKHSIDGLLGQFFCGVTLPPWAAVSLQQSSRRVKADDFCSLHVPMAPSSQSDEIEEF